MARLLDSVAPEVKMISLAVAADELGDLAAGVLDGLLGFPAELVVAAGGVAELAGEVGHHGFEHAGVERRGGVVVHVEGKVDALGERGGGVGDDDSAVAHVRLRRSVVPFSVLMCVLLCGSNLCCRG